MSHCEEYDLVVLGSGRARSFAWSLASHGKRSAVIERRYVTGSCPSIACMPSKNLIHGAKVANYFRRDAEFGIVAGDWKVEMPAVRERNLKMIDGMVALNYDAYRESGTEFIMGEGRFVGPKTIEVATADNGTAHSPWRCRRDQHGLSRADRPDSGSRGGAADDPRRGSRIGPRPEAFGRSGGWLRRYRVGSSDATLRQSRNGHRTERRVGTPRGSRRLGGTARALRRRGDHGPHGHVH